MFCTKVQRETGYLYLVSSDVSYREDEVPVFLLVSVSVLVVVPV